MSGPKSRPTAHATPLAKSPGMGLVLVLVAAASMATQSAIAGVSKVYWTERNNGTVSVLDLGSGVSQILAANFARLQDVDLDTSTSTLYFADWGPPGPPGGQGSINRVNPDGTGLATVLNTRDGVHQLALDEAIQRIYFTRAVSYDDREISHVTTAGAAYTVLLSGTGWFPSGIAVDPAANLLYWGDIGILFFPLNGSVNRVGTDGSLPTQLTPHVNGRGRGYAIDPTSQTIFLTAHDPLSPGSGGAIFSYDIPTNTETLLISDPGTGYWDIEIDADDQRIWWTDYGRGQIRSAMFDGSDVRIEVVGLTGPYGLALELGGESDTIVSFSVEAGLNNATYDGDLVRPVDAVDLDTGDLSFSAFPDTILEDIDAFHVLPDGAVVFSTSTDVTQGFGGIANIKNGDLVLWDGEEATLLFSELVGFGSPHNNIDAFSILPNGNWLLSTDLDATLGGLSFQNGDIVEYDPDADVAILYEGLDEARTFTGTPNSNPDIDALHATNDGEVIFSIRSDGIGRVGNGPTYGFADAPRTDLFQIDPATLDASLFLDGDGLFDGTARNLDAVALAARPSSPPAALACGMGFELVLLLAPLCLLRRSSLFLG